jgi:hypothetical protein
VQQDRQPEDEREHEAEHDVHAADDNKHDVAHRAIRRVHQRGAREAEERATHLATRTRGQDSSGAAGELVERQVPTGVMLAQVRGSSFAIEVAGERHAPLHESKNHPRDQAPDHHALLEM